jgi:hypothetical protein
MSTRHDRPKLLGNHGGSRAKTRNTTLGVGYAAAMARETPAKRIVLATFGSPGDLYPFLAIGAELRARGHQPIVATSDLYRGQIAAASLGFAPVRPDRSPSHKTPIF